MTCVTAAKWLVRSGYMTGGKTWGWARVLRDHLECAAAGRVTGLSLGPVDAGTPKCITWSQHGVGHYCDQREGRGQRRPPERGGPGRKGGWSWRRGRWPNGGPDHLLSFTLQTPCVCVCVCKILVVVYRQCVETRGLSPREMRSCLECWCLEGPWFWSGRVFLADLALAAPVGRQG